MPLLRSIQAEARTWGITWLTNIRGAMENRVAFFLTVVGMLLNNSAFVIVWVLFFQAFGEVNGWGSIESVGLLGFAMFTFGIVFATGDGSAGLPGLVLSGRFDNILLQPRSTYMRTITRGTSTSAWGDILSGALLSGAYLWLSHATLPHILLFLGLLPAGVLVQHAYFITTSLVSFLLLDAENAVKNLHRMFLTPSLLPSALFPGGLRLIFLFLIPSLVAGGIPIESVKAASIPLFLLVWAIALGWLLLSIFLFRLAVRKYESGNLMGFSGD